MRSRKATTDIKQNKYLLQEPDNDANFMRMKNSLTSSNNDYNFYLSIKNKYIVVYSLPRISRCYLVKQHTESYKALCNNVFIKHQIHQFRHLMLANKQKIEMEAGFLVQVQSKKETSLKKN